MIQDSFFQMTFWINLENQDYPKHLEVFLNKQFSLHKIFDVNGEPTKLCVTDGQLIRQKNQSFEGLQLVQCNVQLDEDGIKIYNRHGCIRINGKGLQNLWEQIKYVGIHSQIENYYTILDVQQHQNFELINMTNKCTGQLQTAKKFLKSIQASLILKHLQAQQKVFPQTMAFEDKDSIYVVAQRLAGRKLINAGLNFTEAYFAILKLLHKYHSLNLVIGNLTPENILVLDENYNLEIIDMGLVQTMQFYFDDEMRNDTEMYDIECAKKILFEIYGENSFTDAKSVQELLFDEKFITYFGDSQYFKLLNSKPFQQINIVSLSHLDEYVNNQITQIETFNSIRQSMIDSEDGSINDEPNLSTNTYTDLLKGFRIQKYKNKSFDSSPILSPKPKAKHQHNKSSRQFVLETLLNENIISQKQYDQYYKEEDFQDQQELYQFGEQLQKEISNFSNFTTPIQSQNTTCPNTQRMEGSKNAMLRVTNLIVEVEEEWQQQEVQQEIKPYNKSKVQNVRKNLFSMQ